MSHTEGDFYELHDNESQGRIKNNDRQFLSHRAKKRPAGHHNRIRDMSRLLLFLAVFASCQNVYLGKPLAGEKFLSADSMFPAREVEFPRNSHALPRNVDTQNSSEQSSMCYFMQKSDLESQISCKLRFTRSKFNFNPFGLRFGRRDDAGSVNWKTLIVNGNKLPYLWKHKVPT